MPSAIVTASDSGIGKAAAVLLAQRGFDVGITWRSDEAGAQKTADEVRIQGRVAEVRHLDLSDATRGPGVIAELATALGRLDVLVNNAGTGDSTPFLELVSAGHPGPLLLSAQGTDEIAVAPGPPVGLYDHSAWTTTTLTIPHEAAIMAYTDGLVEGRAAPGARQRLGVAAIADQAHTLIARDGITRELPIELNAFASSAHGGALEDDVAMLVIHPD